jgi:hypothetical protein
MTDSMNERGQPMWLSLQVPSDLKADLQKDAILLGISVSAAARLRLRTGRVPSMNEGDHRG